uniref:HMG box domain-containing protein n=1 Tax=Cyclophora tenuis TaxID=216820 RepID=A0A7S1GNE0_CYCTE|mmetsp:Transcript_3384/g.5745  ORF Transcript_3384/g.5745 Transcript_3384/m.5745 type:complete len:378 (+) Transcript_3384:33-1166(+)
MKTDSPHRFRSGEYSPHSVDRLWTPASNKFDWSESLEGLFSHTLSSDVHNNEVRNGDSNSSCLEPIACPVPRQGDKDHQCLWELHTRQPPQDGTKQDQDGHKAYSRTTSTENSLPSNHVESRVTSSPELSEGGSISTSSSTRTSSRKRKRKTTTLPKRPLSAYNFFVQKERARLAKENEEQGEKRISFEDLGKMIGNKWRNLPESERLHFQKLAEADMERYTRETEHVEKLRKQQRERVVLDNAARTSHINAATTTTTTTTPTPVIAKGGSSAFVMAKDRRSHLPLSSEQCFVPIVSNQSCPSPLQDSHWSIPSLTAKDLIGSDGRPVPAGTVIIVADASGARRRFTVQYAACLMSEEEARQYSAGLRLPTISPGAT